VAAEAHSGCSTSKHASGSNEDGRNDAKTWPAFASETGVSNHFLSDHKSTRWSTTKTKDMFEGSLEVKLPTIWTDEKQSREEAERRERLEERRAEEKE